MSRLTPGWRLAWTCVGLTAAAHGIASQTHAVWYVLLEATHPWSRATLTVGTLLFHLCAAATGVLCGRMLDHRGIPHALLVGMSTLVLGCVGLGLADRLLLAYASFACLGIAFGALGQVVIGKLLAPWFASTERAAPMALATLGAHSGIVLVPAAMALGLTYGRLSLGATLALAACCMVAPSLLVLIPQGLLASETQSPLTPSVPLSLHAAMRQPSYWLLAAALFLVVLTQAGYVAHGVLIYGHASPQRGAWLWSFAALWGLATRLMLLWLRPTVAPRHLALALYGTEALGFAVLAACQQEGLWLYVGAMLVGATASQTIALELVLATYVLGTSAYGTLYGPIYAGTRVAAAIGAVVYGLSVTWTGRYTPVLWGMALALLVASAAIWTATPLLEEKA